MSVRSPLRIGALGLALLWTLPANADGDACDAVWNACPVDASCPGVEALAKLCKGRPQPRAQAPASDLASCQSQLAAADTAEPAWHEAVGELQERAEQLSLDVYESQQLRTGYAGVLERLEAWPGLPSDHARQAAGLCRLQHPTKHKVECSDAFDRLERTLAPAFESRAISAEQAAAFRALLHSAQGRICLPASPGFDDRAWRYVTLLADVGDRSTIFQAGASSGRVERIYTGTALALATRPESILLVIALPKQAAALVRIDGEPQRGRPPRWLELPPESQDALVDVRPHTPACLDVDLRLRAHTRVIIDGRTVGETLDAPRRFARRVDVFESLGRSQSESHRVTVIDSQRAVPLHQRDIELSTGPDAACTPVEIDATVDDTLDLAVLPFNVDPACLQGGVNEVTLRDRVIGYLREQAKQLARAPGPPPLVVRDLSALDSVVQDVSMVESLVARLQGTALAPDRGQQDSMRNLYGGAKEMLRQGFDRVMSVALLCGKLPSGWEYSAAVRSANLARLRGLQPEAIQWDEVFKSETQILTDRRELFDGVVAPVARMLGFPYAIFTDGPTTIQFASSIRIPVEIYTPPQLPESERGENLPPSAASARGSTRLEVARASALDCQMVESRSMLRAAAQLERAEWPWTWDDIAAKVPMGGLAPGIESGTQAASQSGTIRVDITGSPLHPGLYVLRTNLGSQRCIELASHGPELFVGVHLKLSAPWSATRKLRPEGADDGLLLVGLSPQSTLGFAALAGIAVTSRHGYTPPSFDGIETLRFDARGVHGYDLVERAFVIGPALVWQESVCSWARLLSIDACWTGFRRWHMLARVAPLARISFFDLDNVDPGVFPRNRQGELSAGGFDLMLLVTAGMGYRLGELDSVRVLLHLAIPKLSDALSSETKTEATFDARVLFGIGLEYGRTL